MPTNESICSEQAVAKNTPSSTAWMTVAHQFLSFALRYDYLSNGQGHQQSRRVLAERRERLANAKTNERMGQTPSASRDPKAEADAERAYLLRLAHMPRLSSREEYLLAKRVQGGDEAARNALVEANLGLTVMLAQRYRRDGLPLMDLIAEGNFGLIAATRSFDPERGFRFATYAKWAVRQSIERALPRLVTVRQVRLKRSAHSKIVHEPDINLADFDNSQLRADTAPASLLELEECTDVSADGEEHDSYAIRRLNDDPSAYTARGAAAANDEDALLQLAIPEEDEPPSTTQTVQRNQCLARALEGLNARERIIINERYALAGCQTATLEQLALRMKVSIERVRQIECAAVRKLAILLADAGESADTLL